MITTKNKVRQQISFTDSAGIKYQNCNEVGCQILDQVSFSVNCQINKQVDDRIYNNACIQVGIQIRDHLRRIFADQIQEQIKRALYRIP